MDKVFEIDGKQVKVSNYDKVFWPEKGITKGDLIEYYLKYADLILPYIKDRPQSLNRFPNGVYGESFYQKNVESHPEWVRTEKIWSDGNEDYINYVICNDKATLIYLINLGCIDLNVWNSRVDALDAPDFLVLDLDPEDIGFGAVVKSVKEIEKIFKKLEISAYPKTSGATGIHIYVPIKRGPTYEQIKELARAFAILVNKSLPEITSIERIPSKRQQKVYIDFLQNRRGSTMAAPFTVRPVESASVSMPIAWEEIDEKLSPENFTIFNAPSEIKKHQKLFEKTLKEGVDFEDIVSRLSGSFN